MWSVLLFLFSSWASGVNSLSAQGRRVGLSRRKCLTMVSYCISSGPHKPLRSVEKTGSYLLSVCFCTKWKLASCRTLFVLTLMATSSEAEGPRKTELCFVLPGVVETIALGQRRINAHVYDLTCVSDEHADKHIFTHDVLNYCLKVKKWFNTVSCIVTSESKKTGFVHQEWKQSRRSKSLCVRNHTSHTSWRILK